MTYRDLPFRTKSKRHQVNGEPTAGDAKRLLSAIVDYGLPVALFAVTRKTAYADTVTITMCVLLAIANSVVLQGITGYSLGRFASNSTLLRPRGRSGFERPGARIVVRFIPHAVVAALAFPASVSCYAATTPCVENRWLWWVILAGLVASVVIFERSEAQQMPWDFMAKTAVVDRRMGPLAASKGGREFRDI